MKKRIALLLIFLVYGLWPMVYGLAQERADVEFVLDVKSKTIPLPAVFKPGVDLSGRGFHREVVWPQTLAAKEVLEKWGEDIGLSGMYRVQFNLWEISQLKDKKEEQNILLANYENILKKITDAGGIAILNIFGTPQRLGRVLDKKSPPRDMREFKRIIKRFIRDLSCNKKYNIWYEVWNAPDLDDFFLGRKQDYLLLYRTVAEGILELEAETKIYIPIGGPSVSWWFQNTEGNNIITPERSLIYELIQYCYRYRLPLDFISWHAFSSSQDIEKENTRYNKTTVDLIRDWLTYFKFPPNIPLIVDEWNFDADINISPEREEKSFVCASYIPARIKNMHKAGIDYQVYFSLEDFRNNKEGISRNTGIFYFDADDPKYKGGPKCIYNVFRMLGNLGKDMFLHKFEDAFVGVIATKQDDTLVLLFYNYIDPGVATNYISKNIVTLSKGDRKRVLGIIRSDQLGNILKGEQDISKMNMPKKVKGLLKMSKALNDKAREFSESARNIKIELKNLNGNYSYKRFTIDSSCRLNCPFEPVETKDIKGGGSYKDELTMNPYSVNMIVLKQKLPEPEPEAGPEPEAVLEKKADVTLEDAE